MQWKKKVWVIKDQFSKYVCKYAGIGTQWGSFRLLSPIPHRVSHRLFAVPQSFKERLGCCCGHVNPTTHMSQSFKHSLVLQAFIEFYSSLRSDYWKMSVHNWQMGCSNARRGEGVQSDTYQFYKQKVGSFQIWLSRMTTSIAPAMHSTIWAVLD